MNTQRQSGGSTLPAVMLLLVMHLMLLTAQQRAVRQRIILAADQQRYLMAYNQAASALSWGLAQPWPNGALQATKWHCQHIGPEALRACARFSSRSGIVVVRGVGEITGSPSRCGCTNWQRRLARLAVSNSSRRKAVDWISVRKREKEIVLTKLNGLVGITNEALVCQKY